MRRLMLLMALVVLNIGHMSQRASAHVFFVDEAGVSGLIMHVTPDDDPVAGEQSNLYFDIQNQTVTTEKYTFKLGVTDADGKTELAATYPTGKTNVTATYVFPVQGVYLLTLKATPVYVASEGSKEPIIFSYSQRVNRGFSASALDQPRHAWAEFGLVLGSASLLLLITVAIVRRKQILGYTT